MRKDQKKQVVKDLKKLFEENELMVVSHYAGLTVDEITELRNRLREQNAGMKVAKNTLAKLAIKGTKYEGLTEFLTGPSAICYSADPISAAKVAVNFAKKNNKLVVLGGANEDGVLDLAGVQEVASLPTLDEARAMIVGMVSAPAAQLARVFNAYSETEQTT